jgi:hypothetical protein
MNPNGNQPVSSTLSWFFTPGSTHLTCTLAVFVPAQNALGVADYTIRGGAAYLGAVAVDQASAAGQWVTLGRYPATGQQLAVQLSPDLATLTASGNGHGHNGAIAASAASANCG